MLRLIKMHKCILTSEMTLKSSELKKKIKTVTLSVVWRAGQYKLVLDVRKCFVDYVSMGGFTLYLEWIIFKYMTFDVIYLEISCLLVIE